VRQVVGFDLSGLHVHGKIQPTGSGAAGGGVVPGLFEFVEHLFRLHDPRGVFRHLGDGERAVVTLDTIQPHGVIGRDVAGVFLSGKDQARNGIGPSRQHAGDRVAGAGAGGD
jgi:hypothetical protein